MGTIYDTTAFLIALIRKKRFVEVPKMSRSGDIKSVDKKIRTIVLAH
jgi:hypothetical protein